MKGGAILGSEFVNKVGELFVAKLFIPLLRAFSRLRSHKLHMGNFIYGLESNEHSRSHITESHMPTARVFLIHVHAIHAIWLGKCESV